MKNAAFEWTWKCEPELGPTLIYKSKLQVRQPHVCNTMYTQRNFQALRYSNVTGVTPIFSLNAAESNFDL